MWKISCSFTYLMLMFLFLGCRSPLSGPLAGIYGLGSQGNMKAGLAALQTIPDQDLNVLERSDRSCILDRFGGDRVLKRPLVIDNFVAGLILIYQDYWSNVMLQKLSLENGKEYLFNMLRGYLADNKLDTSGYTDLDNLLVGLGDLIEERGYHSAREIVPPYYDLKVWRTENRTIVEVALPETAIPVRAVLLDYLVEPGWEAWATCGKSFDRGWVGNDALYCVDHSHNLSSENFLVSFLSHETQHLADIKTFPTLASPDLEYRAKLTELFRAKDTVYDLIKFFGANTDRNREHPLAFANSLVIEDLGKSLLGTDPNTNAKGLESISTERINEAALALLKANTKKLKAAGEKHVSLPHPQQ